MQEETHRVDGAPIGLDKKEESLQGKDIFNLEFPSYKALNLISSLNEKDNIFYELEFRILRYRNPDRYECVARMVCVLE